METLKVLRHTQFFARGEIVTINKLREFYTEHALAEYIKYGYLEHHKIDESILKYKTIKYATFGHTINVTLEKTKLISKSRVTIITADHTHIPSELMCHLLRELYPQGSSFIPLDSRYSDPVTVDTDTNAAFKKQEGTSAWHYKDQVIFTNGRFAARLRNKKEF